MLSIAGQTAGPIGLKFFVDTHEWPGGCYRLKNELLFFVFKQFFPRTTPGPSASTVNNTCLNLAKPF